MGLFNFKEKKLFSEIEKLGAPEKLQKEFEEKGWKYERLRQTWKSSAKETTEKDLCYKVEQGDIISDQDIKKVEAVAKGIVGKANISKNDEVFKFYIDVLKNTKKIGEKIAQGFKNYEIVDENRKEIRIDNPTDAELKKIIADNTMIKRNAENLTKFFYGPNNFMQEGAKKCFKKYSKLFDLLLKCKGEAYKKVLIEKGADEDTICNQERNLGLLGGLAVELYGRENKYSQKIKEFIEAFNQLIRGI